MEERAYCIFQKGHNKGRQDSMQIGLLDPWRPPSLRWACCYTTTTGYKWTLCYPWMKNDLLSSEKWEVSDSQNEVIILQEVSGLTAGQKIFKNTDKNTREIK